MLETCNYFLQIWSAVVDFDLLIDIPEFVCFLDPTVKAIEWPEDADQGANTGPLGIKEWIPATKRLFRASMARLLQRSPSPHLESDPEMDDVSSHASSAISIVSVGPELASQFAREKHNRRLARRAASLKPSETNILLFKPVTDWAQELCGRAVDETYQIYNLQQKFLESIRALDAFENGLVGSEHVVDDLIIEMQEIDSDDEESFLNSKESIDFACHRSFYPATLIDQCGKWQSSLQATRTHYMANLGLILELIVEDTFVMTFLLNRRMELVQAVDAAMRRQQELIAKLSDSLYNGQSRSSSSVAQIRPMAASNAAIETAIRAGKRAADCFTAFDQPLSKSLKVWLETSGIVLQQYMERFNGNRSK